MSGAGRKHRAKHLTRQYLDGNSWEGPKEGEQMAVCLGSPNSQQVRVLVLSDPTEEQFAALPGKFRKVLWLAIKDVIVVSGGSVVYKPSPEQLSNFLDDENNAEMKKKIEDAQAYALTMRPTQTRAPTYSSKITQSTVSQLPGNTTVTTKEETDDGVDSGEEELDSVFHMGNRNRENIRHRQQFFFGTGEEEEEEEEDEAEDENEEDDENEELNN